jgi:lycopene beta-cyclase
MTRNYDLIILGGGCSGLSIASRLAKSGTSCPQTLILESRAKYKDDRTWCFWESRQTWGSELIRQRWPEMTVESPAGAAELHCPTLPYAMITSQDFYKASLDVLEPSSDMDLKLGSAVRSVVKTKDQKWLVETQEGQFRSSMVIDTRPQRVPRSGDSILWQSFSGVEVRTLKNCFHPGRMTLMDFTQTAGDRILFTYLLPFSERQALIEVTEFSAFPVSAERLGSDLEAAIAKHARGSLVEVVRREDGVLPMGQMAVPESADSSYTYAGLSAGGARPCTGYAFQRIQRWADLCSRELLAGQLPVGHRPDPRWLSGMDALFLRVLRAHPELAPSIFFSLFAGTATDRVIRFLSDEASAIDVMSVVSALPAGPFVTELLAACRDKAMAWQESLVSPR